MYMLSRQHCAQFTSRSENLEMMGFDPSGFIRRRGGFSPDEDNFSTRVVLLH